ncbi:CRISPR-associated endonuclease Cas2 [Ferroplasma acidarmanus]|uniref:CRISPR-associated endoribonuclease Cas2 n=1 Tax=Ferroplasma acidarmanus Fer1 TaxID=333146 RepID=S0AT40_FERAC|nr:CRISPR-associated endonuclease Cas2 [Ferroplasma acidarmanus]AGO61204.1 CRISPR-associated protein Cas2 [Ferroplasma acidarmanus Fer1]
MYIILVYDVSEKRVFKVLKIARKYITWIQNSVLEGEISKGNYEKFKVEIRKTIKPEEDSILFYIIRDLKYTSKENIGIIKNTDEKFF